MNEFLYRLRAEYDDIPEGQPSERAFAALVGEFFLQRGQDAKRLNDFLKGGE